MNKENLQNKTVKIFENGNRFLDKFANAFLPLLLTVLGIVFLLYGSALTKGYFTDDLMSVNDLLNGVVILIAGLMCWGIGIMVALNDISRKG
jgi:uncharacterized membrane protein